MVLIVGLTIILEAFEPPVHVYEVAPDAKSVAVLPEQMLAELTVRAKVPLFTVKY